MQGIKIQNKCYRHSVFLSEAPPLPPMQMLCLKLLGYAKLGSFQPSGFTAPTEFYVVKDKNGYFISYAQSWDKVFYPPEVVK
jgi:hypothetical protein